MHAAKKNMQVLIRPVLGRRKLKSIIPSYLPAQWRVCFVPVTPTVCVSCAFVYDEVNVTKRSSPFLQLNRFIPICVSDYGANTILWLIC